ncbi:acetyltransferase [Aliarcobacter faecis]|uniref:GNAT family N-acetyltransferase n=1 Tax=Aliarcobacter faecis TaxID=1564138 RepID=UPI00047D16D1|nr:GNAT family N-acetyltransferase [Aliarcobacter faecis]QKF73903.1 acetyltransferase [Aliarcobacter faecis]
MIQKANKNNINNIAKLIINAIDDIANTLTGEKDEKKVINTLEKYIKMEICRLSHNNIYTYTKDEKIVGILIAYSSNDVETLDKPILDVLKNKGIFRDSFEKECFSNEFYLDTISVDENFQRQGIAKEFFTYFFDLAKQKGFKKASLLVDYKKEKARSLYEKMGFCINDTLEVSGTNFYHMIKEV